MLVLWCGGAVRVLYAVCAVWCCVCVCVCRVVVLCVAHHARHLVHARGLRVLRHPRLLLSTPHHHGGCKRQVLLCYCAPGQVCVQGVWRPPPHTRTCHVPLAHTHNTATQTRPQLVLSQHRALPATAHFGSSLASQRADAARRASTPAHRHVDTGELVKVVTGGGGVLSRYTHHTAATHTATCGTGQTQHAAATACGALRVCGSTPGSVGSTATGVVQPSSRWWRQSISRTPRAAEEALIQSDLRCLVNNCCFCVLLFSMFSPFIYCGKEQALLTR